MSAPFRLGWFVPYFAPYDAISQLAVAAHGVARERGFDSTLYTPERVALPGGGSTEPIAGYVPRPSDVVVVHYGARSHVEEWLLGLPARRYLYYHNVTPARYFERVGFPWVEALRAAREGLSDFARLGALTDSDYNRRELLAAGFRAATVLPPLLDPTLFAPRPARPPHDSAAPARWLHVGRIVPNKRIEDLIRALYAYRQRDQEATLTLVGSTGESERYSEALRAWTAALGLSEAVTFAGKVSEEAWGAAYREATLYLCLSEHEGFCLPLVEAMVAGVPIIAFRSSAVPETMGESGVPLDDKAPPLVAEVAARLHADPALREALIAGQRANAQRWQPDVARAALHAWLETL